MTHAAPARASYLMPAYRPPALEIVSGLGTEVVDSSGRVYLDFVGGIAVAAVGHCHPAVTRAIADQSSRLVHVSNLFGTRPQARLAERLAGLTGGMQSFFGNSGAEAIECALKIARKHARDRGVRPAAEIVAAHGGFHGRTMGALSATGQPAKQGPFEPLVPGFRHVPFGDVAALADAVGPQTAAVLLEPIQGEAGVIVPPPGYLRAARDLCDRHGCLLILDEIQTGIGRTGAWWACVHEGVSPDVMCAAKALGGGLPIGACLATPEVAETLSPGLHASTFGGGPVQAAAAIAVLDVIEGEGLIERARDSGRRLMDALSARLADCVVRGRGLLVAVDLGAERAQEVVAATARRGVLVNDVGPGVVRLAPALNVPDDAMDRAVEAMGEAWDEIRAA